MIIGVDFDNTIVCFDDVFHNIAIEKKLIPAGVPATKEKIRDYLRKENREDEWTELQGLVYGSLILKASAFPGVREFFALCHTNKIPVYIVSHKTKKPFLGSPYDLHQAATAWLTANGFFDELGLPATHVFFELTKSDKLGRIGKLQCTHFIDDLPEFLSETSFPPGVKRILFDPNKHHTSSPIYDAAPSWQQISSWLLKI